LYVLLLLLLLLLLMMMMMMMMYASLAIQTTNQNHEARPCLPTSPLCVSRSPLGKKLGSLINQLAAAS